MNNSRLQLVAVGAIVKVFGIKGEVIVRPMTDTPSRFQKLTAVWVGPDSQSVSETCVEAAAVSTHGIRIKLKGVDNRTAAEKINRHMLFVEEAHTVRPPRGRYFVHDVVGLIVREENGGALGTVTDVLRYPADDVYVVRGPRGEIMIPAVKEFVREINLGTRTMTVRLIEGMVE